MKPRYNICARFVSSNVVRKMNDAVAHSQPCVQHGELHRCIKYRLLWAEITALRFRISYLAYLNDKKEVGHTPILSICVLIIMKCVIRPYFLPDCINIKLNICSGHRHRVFPRHCCVSFTCAIMNVQGNHKHLKSNTLNHVAVMSLCGLLPG